MADFTNVNIKVGNNTQQIRMEKGVVFENNGGKYTIDANGQLMKFDKKSNVWVQAKQIEMTKYQWSAFQNLSDNDGQVGTYSKRDIQLAQAKYRKSGFTADMQQDLPAGYRIESSKLNSAEGSVQVHIAHKDIKDSNATLKFQIAELADLKAASEAYQADKAQGAQKTGKTQNAGQPQKATQSKFARPKEVSSEDLARFKESGWCDENGKFQLSDGVRFPLFEDDDSMMVIGELYRGFTDSDIFYKFIGKELTPDLINDIVNSLVDSNIEWNKDRRITGLPEEGPFTLNEISHMAKYLKPETLDKILDLPAVMVSEGGLIGYELEDIKSLYEKLTPQQQVKYIKQILSKDFNVECFATSSDRQISGAYTAEFLFLEYLEELY